jgi:hypothetical protein
MVGQWTLDPYVEVQILCPQPSLKHPAKRGALVKGDESLQMIDNLPSSLTGLKYLDRLCIFLEVPRIDLYI